MSAHFELLYTTKVYKEVEKIEPDARRQVIEAIEELQKDARPQNSKKMRGEYSDYRRLRTGDYRVIYQVKDQKLQIVIVRAGHRKDIYGSF